MSSFTNIAPRALYLSCVPPLPRDFGNRNRVFQTLKFLTDAGFLVDFLLYPFDYDWERSIPPYAPNLKTISDMFVVVPPTRKLHQSAAGGHHEIDEWWDVSLDLHIDYLRARRTYDLVFVNYVFFSKALEYFDNKCLKVLDTHDMMSGRKEVFEANGVEPEFFYTTEETESVGLKRADVVLAIKDSEADIFRKMTEAQVISLPFRAPQRESGRVPQVRPGPLRAGFIGAENAVNVVNIKRFFKIFAVLEHLYAPAIEIKVAGNVCRQLAGETYPWLTLLGRVDEVSDFYNAVDVVFVPLAFSTGQKIKVAEALSYGLPIVATRNGFDGFAAHHPLHALDTLREVALALIDLAFEPDTLPALAEASRKVDEAAERVVTQGFDALHAAMSRRFERVVFVVDRPFWERRTLGDELWWQAAEYISHLAPVIALAANVAGAKGALISERITVVASATPVGAFSLPAVLYPLSIVCPDEATRKAIRPNFDGPILVLRHDATTSRIVLEDNAGRSNPTVFPRFLPYALTAKGDVEDAIDIVHGPNTDCTRISAMATNGRRLRIVSAPQGEPLQLEMKSVSHLFNSPTIFFGNATPVQDVAARLLSLRGMSYSHADASQIESVYESLANSLSDDGVRKLVVEPPTRSDLGWDILWERSSRRLR